jgi:hypothetical protein
MAIWRQFAMTCAPFRQRQGTKLSDWLQKKTKKQRDLIGAENREADNMKQSKFPKGWDEERVKRVLSHYESQSEEEAVAEDEAAWEDASQTFMAIPNDLAPAVRELLAKREGN